MSRVWKLQNKNPLPRIAVTQRQSNLYVLDVHSRFRSSLRYRRQTVPYNLTSLALLLRASLYALRPAIKMEYKCDGKRVVARGRIVACRSEEVDAPTSPHLAHLTLFVKLDPTSCPIQPVMKWVNLVIQCPLLPKDRYQYGVCDTLHAKYRVCSDMEYLRAPGRSLVPDVGPSKDRTRCAVFLLRPGTNPLSYCKLDFSF